MRSTSNQKHNNLRVQQQHKNKRNIAHKTARCKQRSIIRTERSKTSSTSATRTNASMKKDRTIHSEPDSTANSRAATAAAQSAHQARLRLALPLRRQLHCYHHHPRLFLSYNHHSCHHHDYAAPTTNWSCNPTTTPLPL